MTNTTVAEKNMGTHKWVTLDIQILAGTRITHALTPDEALRLADQLVGKAIELKKHNCEVDEVEWQNMGCPMDPDQIDQMNNVGCL